MKQKNTSNWLLWVLLILLPPFGIIYMWVTKKEFTSQKKTGLTIIFGIWFIFCIFFVPSDNETKDIPANSTVENNDTSVSTVATEEPEQEATAEPVKTPEATKSPKVTKSPKPTKKPRKKAIGKSNKDVTETDNDFYVQDMREDVTGNFRKVEISDADFIPQKYALSYYRNYFNDDKEVHNIVNFATMTTTCITRVSDMLNVTITEYEDNEQFSAKTIGGGMLLEQYIIYLDNGDIEKIKIDS